MAKLNPITEYQDPWDLNDPEVKKVLRKFESEINIYQGPYKYEQWLLANGHVVRDDYFQILDIVVPDHVCEKFGLPKGYIYKKVEYSKLQNMKDIAPKYLALRKLQKRTEYAKAQEVPPIEAYTEAKEELNIWS